MFEGLAERLEEALSPDHEEFICETLVVNKDYYEQTAGILTCLICGGLLNDPVMCNQCETSYCKSCVNKWKKTSNRCIMKCRNALTTVNVSRSLKNIMDIVKLKCAKCGEQSITLGDYPSHRERCKKVTRMKCPYCANCSISRDDYENSFQGKTNRQFSENLDEIKTSINIHQKSNYQTMYDYQYESNKRFSTLDEKMENIIFLISSLTSTVNSMQKEQNGLRQEQLESRPMDKKKNLLLTPYIKQKKDFTKLEECFKGEGMDIFCFESKQDDKVIEAEYTLLENMEHKKSLDQFEFFNIDKTVIMENEARGGVDYQSSQYPALPMPEPQRIVNSREDDIFELARPDEIDIGFPVDDREVERNNLPYDNQNLSNIS